MKRMLTILALCCAAALVSCGKPPASPAKKIKIGFIIPEPTNEWYQWEWQFADEAAQKYNFDLIKLPAKDGKALDDALNTLGTKGAQGVIVCPPQVNLGTSVVEACNHWNMKLMGVDDRMEDAQNRPLAQVPHVGIDARKIGELVGDSLVNLMKERKWNLDETGALGITWEEAATSRDRTDGCAEVLKKAGLPEARIVRVPRRTPDTVGAVNAAKGALTAHPNVKNWLVFSSNDDGVIGALRALEDHGYKPENIIGIGVDGTKAADNEFAKKDNGFVATVLLQPKLHGYNTAESMFKWITEGKEPQPMTYTKGVLVDRSNYIAEKKRLGLLQ